MTGFRFQLLGPPKFQTLAGNPVTIRSRKGTGLLACLALADGQPVGRDHVCALLWSDRQTTQARASLRQLLVDLRQDFGQARQVLDTETDGVISFYESAAIASDIGEFHRHRRGDDRQSLEQAFALRRGQFLEGLAPEDSIFADWLEDNRRALDNLWCEATTRLLRVLERDGDHRRSQDVAGRLLSVDPLCELAHQSVIRAHVAMNNRSLALRHYQEFREKLDRELGVEPDALTRSIVLDAPVQCSVPSSSAAASPLVVRPRVPKASIAVLPFEQSGGDPQDLHFAAGLTEDLSTELSRFADLAVIAQASARQHAQADEGRSSGLDAEYMVRGSVRRAEQRVRITASLVHAADGVTLWSERFDRVFADLFALQDDIVRRVVTVLSARVQAFEMEKVLQKPPIGYEAYDLFLKARFQQRDCKKEGILAARTLLREAIAREPRFASAHAELSLGYSYEHQSDWSTDLDLARREAIAAAEQAIAIDPTNSNGHRALAEAQFYCNRNFDVAKAQAEIALVQNPNDQFSMCLLGFAFACNGHATEGQRYSLESLKLNPLVSDPCLFAIAVGAYFEGGFADAASGFARVARTIDEAHAFRAASLWNLGQADAARDAMQHFMSLKRGKMADYPGDDVDEWRAYLLRILPIADSDRREELFETFRRAGLPV
ncbi:BTAD domain-containing putative transcriptional regulator [Dongia sp.]|uniref:BTAD domain-containing putative transcriptional regulator n=1 Tax=Dongia sp. TaxID=1977262 RepID=UPI003752B015